CGFSQLGIDLGSVGRTDFVIVIVRLREILFSQKQCVETFAPAEFEILVHLNRFKRTNLDADLAAHANRDVDVEHLWIKLRFAHVIGLLVFAFNDINALRRTFLLAYLARHTAQPRVWIIAVIKQKRKITIIIRKRIALLGILHCDQAFLVEIASDKI